MEASQHRRCQVSMHGFNTRWGTDDGRHEERTNNHLVAGNKVLQELDAGSASASPPHPATRPSLDLSSLQCPICLEFYNSPALLSPSGITYCRDCITAWLAKPQQQFCPVTKIKAKGSSIVPNYALQALLEQHGLGHHQPHPHQQQQAAGLDLTAALRSLSSSLEQQQQLETMQQILAAISSEADAQSACTSCDIHTAQQALSPLVRLLGAEHSDRVRACAAELLAACCSLSEGLKAAAVELGAVEALQQLLQPAMPWQAQANALEALRHLHWEDDAAVLCAAAKLGSKSHINLLFEAAELLHRIIATKSRAEVRRLVKHVAAPGLIVEGLISLLRSTAVDRVSAAGCIKLIAAASARMKQRLVSAGAVAAAAAALATAASCSGSQFRVLVHSEFQHKSAIQGHFTMYTSSHVEHMVQQELESEDRYDITAPARVLKSLCEDNVEGQAAAAGAVPCLVRLAVGSAGVQAEDAALDALLVVVRGHAGNIAVAEGVVRRVLEAGEEGVRESAATLLEYIEGLRAP